MSNGLFSSAGISSRIGCRAPARRGGAVGGSSSQLRREVAEVALGQVDALLVGLDQEVAAAGRPVCIRAPPISSSVTFSPITISAIRGEPRYIDALPSRMITTSQNAGM